MKKMFWLTVIAALLLLGCKQKKKQVSDDEGLTTGDFISLFSEIPLPYYFGDSTFRKKNTDTVSVSFKNFSAIVPDTLLEKTFGKNGRPRIYPVGKVTVKKKETYLLARAVSSTKKAAYVLVFNQNNQFVTGLPVLVPDNNSNTDQSAVMDSRYSVTTNTQHKDASGKLIYRKAAYAYINGNNAFELILTESNAADTKRELQDPIDSLPVKNKLAGDYWQDKLNLVAIRDGRKPGEIRFFVHFEKDEASCKGELKGEARLVTPGKAVYSRPGDQCMLEFNFGKNKVSLREDGCGSHRDIKCFFDGTFTRKPIVLKSLHGKTPPKRNRNR